MLDLGVDLYKKNCWVRVLDADGHQVDSHKLSTERAALLGYFGKVLRPAAVAVDATFNWYYFLDQLSGVLDLLGG